MEGCFCPRNDPLGPFHTRMTTPKTGFAKTYHRIRPFRLCFKIRLIFLNGNIIINDGNRPFLCVQKFHVIKK